MQIDIHKKQLIENLSKWRDALASDIDNIDDQIKTRMKSLEKYMQKRDDIDALIDWLENNELPMPVLRAIYGIYGALS